jgi:transcriptional regulator with XRE-family HTH domain
LSCSLRISVDILHIKIQSETSGSGTDDTSMITGAQMKAARALLGLGQKDLAAMAGLSVPTVQRMEASAGDVRGVVESLTRIVTALQDAGVELIPDDAVSDRGGRGVRLRDSRLRKPASSGAGDQG